MPTNPINQYTILFLTIVSIWVLIEYHAPINAFFTSGFKKYRCKAGLHNAAKSKYYCADCKKAAKSHLKVIDGNGEFKKKINDFKF